MATLPPGGPVMRGGRFDPVLALAALAVAIGLWPLFLYDWVVGNPRKGSRG